MVCATELRNRHSNNTTAPAARQHRGYRRTARSVTDTSVGAVGPRISNTASGLTGDGRMLATGVSGTTTDREGAIRAHLGRYSMPPESSRSKRHSTNRGTPMTSPSLRSASAAAAAGAEASSSGSTMDSANTSRCDARTVPHHVGHTHTRACVRAGGRACGTHRDSGPGWPRCWEHTVC
jgi:hypothetical protein